MNGIVRVVTVVVVYSLFHLALQSTPFAVVNIGFDLHGHLVVDRNFNDEIITLLDQKIPEFVALICQVHFKWVGVDSGGVPIIPSGYGLIFHPDFIKAKPLGKAIRDYSFFSYEINEALHLSRRERNTIVEVLKKIGEEIEQNIDRNLN